jgi:two-component system OmpR family response regulator
MAQATMSYVRDNAMDPSPAVNDAHSASARQPSTVNCQPVPMRLLLIEDDLQAAEYLVKGLRENGYAVEHSADGRDGLAKATSERYDVIIADRQLPHVDGLVIITALREKGDRTPVLILSALGTVDDRVHGLKAGGDDYLTKPFAMVELLARIEALSRRVQAAADSTHLKVADLDLDLLARRVSRAGRNIDLTTKEFQLLEYLMRRPGQVVTRTMLLEGVWNLHFDPQTNIIDVHMSRLRTAVDRGFDQPLIHTVRGAGYVLRDEA